MLPRKLLDLMPRHKPPSSLEELAFQSISTLVSNTMEHTLLKYCKLKSIKLLPVQKENPIELDLSDIKEYLYSNFPQVLGERMTSHLLKAIASVINKTKCTEDYFKTTGDDNCRYIISQFIIISINPHLTQIDVTKNPHIIRKVLCENLNKMSKLEVLSIRAFGKWEESQKLFLANLASLENLVSFTMEQDCTEDIIAVLGKNCKKLKCFVANGASKLNNSCIDSLLQFQNLEQLELYSTNISEEGYIKLLTKMGQNNSDTKPNHKTPLKILACSLIRNITLEILVECYPNLKIVSLSSLYCDLSLLKGLKCLEQLKLIGGNFVTDNIKGFIQEKGSSLKLLGLLLIQDIDLVWLGKYCTELKHLNIRSCTCIVDVPSSQIRKEVAFQKLENLVFYVQCSLQYLHYLLVNCINIRKITCGLIREVDDRFMQEVISQNPMKKLEEFKVYFSSNLTFSTVQLLMRKCPSLSCFGGLETWDGISQLELWCFRDDLKKHNINIEIVQ